MAGKKKNSSKGSDDIRQLTFDDIQPSKEIAEDIKASSEAIREAAEVLKEGANNFAGSATKFQNKITGGQFGSKQTRTGMTSNVIEAQQGLNKLTQAHSDYAKILKENHRLQLDSMNQSRRLQEIKRRHSVEEYKETIQGLRNNYKNIRKMIFNSDSKVLSQIEKDLKIINKKRRAIEIKNANLKDKQDAKIAQEALKKDKWMSKLDYTSQIKKQNPNYDPNLLLSYDPSKRTTAEELARQEKINKALYGHTLPTGQNPFIVAPNGPTFVNQKQQGAWSSQQAKQNQQILNNMHKQMKQQNKQQQQQWKQNQKLLNQLQKQQQQQLKQQQKQQQQLAKAAAKRAQQDKDEKLKFTKDLVKRLGKLPVFQKTGKIMQDMFKLQMLAWASDKPKWVQKLTLGMIGLQIPETIGKMAGDTTSYVLGNLASSMIMGQLGKGGILRRPFLSGKLANRGKFAAANKVALGGSPGFLGSPKGLATGFSGMGKFAKFGGLGLGALALDMTLGQSSNPFLSTLGSTSSMALTGASIGSLFGPGLGTAIGAALGGSIGLITGLLKSIKKDTGSLADEINTTYQASNTYNAGGSYVPNDTPYNVEYIPSPVLGSKPVVDINSVNYEKKVAEQMLAKSGKYENINNFKSPYWFIRNKDLTTDTPFLRTGVLPNLKNVFDSSPVLRNNVHQYAITSAMSSAGTYVNGKWVNTPHAKNGMHPEGLAVDLVATGGKSLQELADELNKSGLFKAVVEDAGTPNAHVHAYATERLIKKLDEDDKKRQEYYEKLVTALQMINQGQTPSLPTFGNNDPSGTGASTKAITLGGFDYGRLSWSN